MITLNGVKYISVAELVIRWNNVYSAGTLANWRVQQKGPKHIKWGGRCFYDLRSVKKYEQEMERVSKNGS